MTSVSVTFGPWMIVNDDVVRQYEFKSAPPSKDARLQIRCRIELGSPGHLYHHLFFIVQPALSQEREGFLVARIGTLDGQSVTEPFTVRAVYMEGDGTLIGVMNRQDVGNCLDIFFAAKTMQITLWDTGGVLFQVPLDNDATCKERFEDNERKILGRSTK